ncbi:MAG: hypothetical protein IPI46_02580 [Bacteroidetes bacterium]|nr:hypothetical protein [Bacteroidota bacterium]
MKKIYLYKIIYTLSLLFVTQQIFAVDRLVVSGGAGGAYATLGAAIAAASANDRIIVTPHAAAFTEGTLLINKSLQILSATEGGFYSIDGNINVAPATAGISLTISGMRLLTGGIQSTIASPVGARSTINIIYDSLTTGSISFNHDNYNLICASNYIKGGVTMRFGKVLGNVIPDQIIVNTDASVNNPTDSVWIIGNKINFYTPSNLGAITWNSTSQFFNIQNNFITLSYPGHYVNYGIWSSNSKNSNAGTNTVFNNTIVKPTYILAYGIVLTTGASSYTEVQNNLVMSTIYNYAYYFNGGNFSVHYNYANNFNITGITNDGTNGSAVNTTLNAEGLNTDVLSNTVNGGNPDAAFDDINLTRNDAGCYGGSFTLTNFMPITSTDWARVIMLTAPRRVMINGTININATGFDK